MHVHWEPGNEAIVNLNCTSPSSMLHSLGMGLEVLNASHTYILGLVLHTHHVALVV